MIARNKNDCGRSMWDYFVFGNCITMAHFGCCGSIDMIVMWMDIMRIICKVVSMLGEKDMNRNNDNNKKERKYA